MWRHGWRGFMAAGLMLLFAGEALAHRLAQVREEVSPYLRRTAERTPVDWWVWDQDLFATARRLGRPVFVTVGYAACYWCHRFERESLVDPAITELLQQRFLPVVVDREAQPDVDDWLQQEAVRLGAPRGWPLQLVLTPAGEPVYAFGYVPPRRGPFGPGTREHLEAALAAVTAAVAGRAPQVEELRRRLGAGAFDWRFWQATVRRLLEEEADPFFGGFGDAAKRLRAPALEAIWRYALRSGDQEARDFVLFTLRMAARSPAFDHLEGGFFRYLRDPAWRRPHFEKMLYTQAQWVRLLALVQARAPAPLFADRIRRTIDFVERRLRLPSGLYAGSLDAESPGGEGAYYRWDETDLRAVLGEEAAARLLAVYALDPRGVLHLREEAAEDATLRPLLRRLLEARQRRPPPPRDDKAVLAWNALWAEALITAGVVLDEAAWRERGVALARRLSTLLRREDGTYGRYRLDARVFGRADVEDLAALGLARMAAFELTLDPADLAAARRLAATMVARGFDPAWGAFGRRPAPGRFVPALRDGETMAANARAAMLLARLFHLTGGEVHRQQAAAAVAAAQEPLRRQPLTHASHLLAFEELHGMLQVVVIGRPDEAAATRLLATVRRSGIPARVLQRLADTSALPPDHPAYGKTRIDGQATAYVCSGPICSLPVTTPADLTAQLRAFLRLPQVQDSG